MTTIDLLSYYSSLLILQYQNKPNATGMIQTLVTPVVMPQTSIQTITFPTAPTSGSFVVSYDGNNSAAINWNDSASTIQSKLQAVPGLSSATVSGSISGQLLTVTFLNVTPPAFLLVLGANSLMASSVLIVPIVTETDITLPMAVQDGFNLTGSSTAIGIQLDTLGKYAGVTRYGTGFSGQPITLGDSDFLQLIKMAIASNNNGSSMADIENLMNVFFPGQVVVTDYQDMAMSYQFASSIGSQNLVELFVTEGLLPAPMTVAVSVIYVVFENVFSFVTYQIPTQQAQTKPFNTYQVYETDWPFLTYQNGIIP